MAPSESGNRREFMGRALAAAGTAGLLGAAPPSRRRAARSATTSAAPSTGAVNPARLAHLVGQRFRAGKNGVVTLIRAEATPARRHRPASASFTFLAPAGVLGDQAVYRLQHPSVGAFDVLLVPVVARRRGAVYEAIFG